MIDIHCHILHDIDDGAKNLEESVDMCRRAMENNITKIIATPHFMPKTLVLPFVEKRDLLVDELRQEIKKRNINLEIVPAAEVYVSDEIFYVSDLEKLKIPNTNYMLIEFDFVGLTYNRIVRYVNEINKFGIDVIIAHPERYKFMYDDYSLINQLRERGVLFQVNAGSLLGAFGKKEQKLARELCVSNSAFFLASDAHSMGMRNNGLLEMFGGFSQSVPGNQLQWMLEEAPNRLLSGGSFDDVRSTPIKKKLFSF